MYFVELGMDPTNPGLLPITNNTDFYNELIRDWIQGEYLQDKGPADQ